MSSASEIQSLLAEERQLDADIARLEQLVSQLEAQKARAEVQLPGPMGPEYQTATQGDGKIQMDEAKPTIPDYLRATLEHRLGQMPGMQPQYMENNPKAIITAGKNIARNILTFAADQVPQVVDGLLNAQSLADAENILRPFITFPVEQLGTAADALYLSYIPNYLQYGEEEADRIATGAQKRVELAPEGPAMGLAALYGGIKSAPKKITKITDMLPKRRTPHEAYVPHRLPPAETAKPIATSDVRARPVEQFTLAKPRAKETVGPTRKQMRVAKEIGKKQEATPAKAIKDVKEGVAESTIGVAKSREIILAKIDNALKTAPEFGNNILEFDIPGDGVFKIRNNVNSLTEFRKKAVKSLSGQGEVTEMPRYGVSGDRYSKSIRQAVKSGDEVAYYERQLERLYRQQRNANIEGIPSDVYDRQIADTQRFLKSAKRKVQKQTTLPADMELHAGLNLAEAGSKSIPNFIKQVRNRVKTEPGKELIRKIEFEADTKWHRRAGEKIESFRRRGLRRLNEEQGIKLADDLDAGRAPEYKKILDGMWFTAKAKGVKLSGYLKNYFPRMLKKEIAETIYDNCSNIERKHEILRDLNVDPAKINDLIKTFYDKGSEFSPNTKAGIGHLIKTGQAKNYFEAWQKLRSRVYEDLFRPYGNIEKKRLVNLPKEFYERDARKVLPRYALSWAKRVAEVETFGVNESYARTLLEKIYKLDPEEARIARRILDTWSGEFEIMRNKNISPKYRKVMDAFTNFQLATKIALGFATVLNVTQTVISTAATAGWVNTLKGMRNLFKRTPKTRINVRSSGATLQTAIEAIAGYEPRGLMGKVSHRLLQTQGFKGINKANQYIGAATGEQWFPQLYKTAHGKPHLAERMGAMIVGRDRVIARARARLKDFGIDYKQKLTPQKLREAMYRFATDTQLQKNILSDPLFANDPVFRPFYLFKRFGVRQVAFIKDHIIKKELMQHKNPIPLLRLVVGGVIGGEVINEAKALISKLLSGEEMNGDDKSFVNRVIDDLATVGAMGYLFDFFNAENKLSQLKWQASPIQLSELAKIYGVVDQIRRDLNKYELKDVARRAIKPASRLFGTFASRAARRVETPSQKKGRIQTYRTKARGEYMDALLEGRNDDAQRVLSSWMKNHKNTPLFNFNEDIDKLVLRRYMNNQKRRLNP